MHLGQETQSRHPPHVGDEAHAAGCSRLHSSDSPRHDRPQAIGAYDDARAEYAVFAEGIANLNADDLAPFDNEIIHRMLGNEGRAGSDRAFQEAMIENNAGDREPGGSRMGRRGEAKFSSEAGTSCADYRGTFQLPGAPDPQGLGDAELVEQRQGARANVFGTGLITGEGGTVNQGDLKSGPGEVIGGRTTGWARPNDERVELTVFVVDAPRISVGRGRTS